MDFHCIGSLPEVTIGTLAEFLVFGKFAGVRVEGVPMECHGMDAQVMRVGVGGMEGP